MKTNIYDWKRYWHNQNESPLIINGFLIVHEYTQNIFTLDSVSDVPCIVLLGEPGMGKSKEIERIYESQVDDKNDKLRFNLSSTGEEKIIRQSIFESDKINKWKQNDSNLYLFLDSLDEALLNINTLAILLAEELEKLPIGRLYLRIACRTAEWSNLSILENKLRHIWKEDKCQILQIAPLQQTDVELTAQTENLDSQKFVAEIFNKNVSVLAAKPVTLRFLVNLFRNKNSFPSTQTELYKQGCLTLCEERSETRIASKLTGKLNIDQRLVIAARIAALMIFSNKSSIWIGKTIGQEDSDLLLSELYGYLETVKGIEFPITEEHIKEIVFDTGLFTGNGKNRSKFSHQTFAEFLASWYLEYRKVSDETIIEIIGETYLYPQLYETSAWIANQRQNIFEHLMKIAPTTLLRSDILLADNSTKTKLVSILLDLFDKEKSEGIDRSYYRKLNHPKLAEQIRPYIIDKTKGRLVRTEALDILQMCEIKELQSELLEIVLDKEDIHAIRVHAAYAIKAIGNNETKIKLKPLIFYSANDDPDSMLKGVALNALWNEHITAKELFSVVTPPNHHFTGSYEMFLSYEMVDKLQTEDLPIALDWLNENINQFGQTAFSERRLVDEILLKSWDNLENVEIFERLIKILAKLLHELDDLFKEIQDKEKLNQIIQETYKRRKTWLKLFSLTDINDSWWLERSQFIALRNNDINWLAKEWEKTVETELKSKLLIKLKSFISYWGTHPDALDAIHKACEENANLKKEFEEIFAPIELGSEKAKQQKELFNEQNKWKRDDKQQQEEERNKPIQPSPLEHTLQELNKFENGDMNGFWQVNWWLMFLPNGRSNKNEFESDLTQFPVWNDLEEHTKLRIIDAAKSYLKKGNPENEKWITTNTIYRPAFAGYRALILAEKFEPAFVKNLSKSIWEKWSAIVYYFPINDEHEKHQQLIAKIYKIVPEKLIELFKQELKNKSEDNYWSFEKLKFCWDERLKDVLKEKLKDNTLSVLKTKKILSQLFELKDTETEKIVCDFVKFPLPKSQKEQEFLRMAVALLIANGKTSCWKNIWEILENDIDFGRSIIESGVSQFGRLGVQELSEEQMSNLYLWLSKQYPHKEDPVHYGVYSPTSRDEIVMWRDSILGTLLGKGTIEAVNEIKILIEKLPHLEWLKFTLLKATEKMREITWNPYKPQSLLILLLNNPLDNSMEQVNNSMEQTEEDISIMTTDTFQFNGELVKENPFLRELLDDYQKVPAKFAFFVGSGLSAEVFPMWKKLLKNMVEYCFNLKKINQADKEELYDKLEKGADYLGIASLCKDCLGPTNYNAYLIKEFSNKHFSPKQLLAYRQLFNIKPKMIITTNFDLIPDEIANIPSLEHENSISDSSSRYSVYANTNTSIGKAQNDWADDKPIVFKMHGCINAGGIVFTQEDFREIIYSNSQIRNFLNAIFTKQTVVFIGFGLSDPHIDSILSYLYENNKGKGKPHYILINDLSNINIRLIEKKYEIRVINYTSTDGHPQVLEFLQLLGKTKDI